METDKEIIEEVTEEPQGSVFPMASGEGLELTALISIIVPVYNTEQYLRQCVDSLVGQSYRSLEIVLADDGSTDSSGAIADEYAAADSRVKVIHKPNGGVSSARNEALKVCTGEYILFVDSDDWIAPDTCERVLRAMTANDADVCFYNLYMHNENGREYLRRKNAPEGVCDRHTLILETLQNYYMCINNKCFRRDVISKNGRIHEFDPATRILEDGKWLIETSGSWKKGVLLSSGLGYRRLWGGSALGDTNKRNQTNLEYLRTFRTLVPIFAENGEDVAESAKEHFMAFAMDSMKIATTRSTRPYLKAIVAEMEKTDSEYIAYVIANLYNRLYTAEKKARHADRSITSRIKNKLKNTAKKLLGR